ncbi:hypothetical protein [Paramicrobacterium chengjingii]|uniref:DUF11 domain-containing protein n=1 Tax=Paramicrobacterium chengjingii TaxID=2769067 RepID=A0ABX6YFJ5_9MICO|nr:hypothetical protein [Microbacterium chengjingii]QPZ37445.1 hypothetical protein HCR76_11430 [Microbacterium chengjingii]
MIALAAATPAAAASTTQPQVNLWTQARNPNESISFTSSGGVPVYQGARTLTYTITYGNYGPETMPAGALVSFSLPLDAVWGSIGISSVSNSYSLAFIGRTATDVSTDPDEPNLKRAVWSYTVNEAIPAGMSFDVVFTVPLNDTVSESTDYWKVRTRSTINIGAADVVEAVPENDLDYSDTYVHYNHRMNVDLASTARRPVEARDGVYQGDPYYSGPGRLTFIASYANNGTETLPAGSEITFQLPFDGIWTNFNIDANPSGRNITYLKEEQISLGGTAKGRLWTYTVNERVAPGASFNVTFGAFLSEKHTTASNDLKARIKTTFKVGSAMATDLTNDSGSESGLTYFNNATAEA